MSERAPPPFVKNDAPSDDEKALFTQAWASKMGDGSTNVEHEV